MGQAIAVRTDYTAGEVRRFDQRAKDAAQARRLLAIAAVLDGASREDLLATSNPLTSQTEKNLLSPFSAGQEPLRSPTDSSRLGA